MQTNTLDSPTITVSGPAEPVEVARLRAAVSDWVDDVVPVSAERRADILLATDEAMSNCADHAYQDRRDPGSMSVEVTYHHDAARLTVCVTDDGAWVEPAPRTSTALRGRGITLMNALADDVTIDGRLDGTSVYLRFSAARDVLG
ncbi:ATP-binding protein [Mycolicibacterium sediminis]|uniref:Histidine kinase/HSP90-like ATPase domain-containing protein n=1 Tax=Mycolicibacterium sediminis TaxID=1286180 RepID=A0A7I7QSK8_9MYCO|nr:ATP-binding protein [Mycolicibacterium sediminis]BBY29040.1 hypothetical protein MSEDJ_31360 [Mycolicibacterium sediminis]